MTMKPHDHVHDSMVATTVLVTVIIVEYLGSPVVVAGYSPVVEGSPGVAEDTLAASWGVQVFSLGWAVHGRVDTPDFQGHRGVLESGRESK